MRSEIGFWTFVLGSTVKSRYRVDARLRVGRVDRVLIQGKSLALGLWSSLLFGSLKQKCEGMGVCDEISRV